ncbi:MAG: hypothetical protein GY804_09705 [Alphaproteobacteria bacterium]|nr:hypothetical protein [Alphaproteobacteria bacterium]
MKHASKIYAVLSLGMDKLDELVRYYAMIGDQERVQFYCKAIAVKSMGLSLIEFRKKHLGDYRK